MNRLEVLFPDKLRSRNWLRKHLNKRAWKNYLRWERNWTRKREVQDDK